MSLALFRGELQTAVSADGTDLKRRLVGNDFQGAAADTTGRTENHNVADVGCHNDTARAEGRLNVSNFAPCKRELRQNSQDLGANRGAAL